MKTVITYGTYDMLHQGHINLLKRARALGDYLIVGVTAEDFDRARGKLNVRQSLMERIEAVRKTGLANEIIIEEYEGQKIDDIRRLNVDIFTVGSDWVGQFDYLQEYCKVVYLPRTEGVSSSELRSEKYEVRLGIVGNERFKEKFFKEAQYVNGLHVVGLCQNRKKNTLNDWKDVEFLTESYEELLDRVSAVCILSHPSEHFEQAKKALERGIHVLCESPLAFSCAEYRQLFELARTKGCVLMEGIKTAYATAFRRLLLLIKGGVIGDVVSVDATCTSLRDLDGTDKYDDKWNSICAWGPTALLPIFSILGSKYRNARLFSKLAEGYDDFDLFTKADLLYEKAVASIKVGKGIKSEGELLISGTRGYVYVPAPWWKTDYFELRYEDQNENKRYFYQLDGEGIRQELIHFLWMITGEVNYSQINEEISFGIASLIEKFYAGEGMERI